LKNVEWQEYEYKLPSGALVKVVREITYNNFTEEALA